MANIVRKISAAVGIRNGQTMMPNTSPDLAVVTELFDRIPISRGGSAEIGGVWASERNALIAEVAAQIVAFQTANARPVIDGVLDPNGGTLKLMNQLAADPSPGPNGGITATVAPAPAGYPAQADSALFQVADVASLSGTGQLVPADSTASYFRRLVRVEGSSINWFGVLFPKTDGTVLYGTVPHLFFTPTPIQGGYTDATYDSFGGSPPWGKLWHDYTWGMGRQIAAAGADQVLVIPFYRTAQSGKLGDFLNNWRDVISAVVTEAINSIEPLYLRDTYTFDRICSSSFSNGWVAHNGFNTQAVGAGAMTDVWFDLDGQAASPPSMWRGPNGVCYLNRPAPARINPVGNLWYVGERWARFAKYWPGGIKTHNACASYLLYHGVWQYCT